ncbi:MAG: L-threonylcarbamoyladenylate synthase [Candidatus Pacebacteria bacterium]|nr:L-threonylcarbamoyladenylate synthase [Candidatus Paceibacterota bacterium]
MRVVKINLKKSAGYLPAVKIGAQIIKDGGVIICPSDTVYGLWTDATNARAAERIFKIKKRKEANPLLLVIPNLEAAKKIAVFGKELEKKLLTIWPGAVTVVFRRRQKLPRAVTAGRSTIALRIPDFKLARILAEEAGVPLISTSANISGELPTNKAGIIVGYFGKEKYQPDLFLNAGNLSESKPSTILDLSGKKPKILREGKASGKKLLKIFNK